MFAKRVSSDLANPFIRRNECRIDGDFVVLDMFQSKSGSGFGTSIFLSSASNILALSKRPDLIFRGFRLAVSDQGSL